MRTFAASVWLALVSVSPALGRERFACNLHALSPPERARHGELTRLLWTTVAEKVELENGYGFRLPASELPHAAEWVTLEARCCPFFTFALAQARDQGPLWLRLTGSPGVKAFIRAELAP